MKVLIAMGLLTWLFGHAASAESGGFRSTLELREAVMEAMKVDPAIRQVRPVDNSDTSIESRVGDNTVVTDVGNLFNYLKTYPHEDPKTWIERLIQSSIELNSFDVSAERLVPLIRTSGYVAETGMDIPRENVVGDLELSYAFEHSSGYANAGRDELATLKLASVRSTAIDNLARMLPHLLIEDDGGPLVLCSIDERFGLSPSLILLDAFWAQVAKRFPEGSIFIVPRRDKLFLIDKRDPGGMDYARRLIDAMFKDDFALQSRGIFERNGGELVLIEYH
jgi:hypothetical protein